MGAVWRHFRRVEMASLPALRAPLRPFVGGGGGGRGRGGRARDLRVFLDGGGDGAEPGAELLLERSI